MPAAQLFRGEGLTLDQLVLVETLGIGWHAVRRAGPDKDDAVLVLGAGPVGLAVAQAAGRTTSDVLVADCPPTGFASPRTAVWRPSPSPMTRSARARARDGDLPSLVFDATGNRGSMEASFDLGGRAGGSCSSGTPGAR